MIDRDLVLEDFYGLLHDFESNRNLPIIMLTASYDMITPSAVHYYKLSLGTQYW